MSAYVDNRMSRENLERASRDMKEELASRVRNVIAVAGSTVLIVFSLATVLYNLPPGPLRAVVGPALQLMDPWLSQNWSLFAPEPPMTDTGLSVRYLRNGSRDETQPFVDVTTPALISEKHTLLPNRKYRVLTSAIGDYLSAEEALIEDANKSGDSSDAAIDDHVSDALRSDSTSQLEKSKYYQSRLVLIRAVNYFYKIAQGHSASRIDAAVMQIRIVEYQYPRFEEKQLPSTNDIRIWTLPWWETEGIERVSF